MASLFLYQAHAQPLSYQSNVGKVTSTSPGHVSLSGEAMPAATVTDAKAPMLELHIANNGAVLLRGARVVSVSGNTIHAEMVWGTSDLKWALETGYNTRFLDSKGEKQTLGDIKKGDAISITGMLIESGSELIIDTQFVREQS